MSTTYGIDLGTTYSCLAQVSELSDEVAEVIANRDNDSTTPSVVLVDQGEVIVGRQAKNMARVKPENVARLFKPDMGSEHPFCEIAGKEYWAHELSSLVLKKLVADAADQGHDVHDVVITVPAYFGFLERSATKLAGELAGLNVIGVIPEPTAAAVAYGLRLDPDAPATTLLVYDLGGGTFDVSVVVCEGGSVRVVTTEGDHELGGSQWDEALVEQVIGRFLQDNPAAADPRSSPHDDQELLSQVEQLKQALTERESSEVVVRSGAAMGIIALVPHFSEAISPPIPRRGGRFGWRGFRVRGRGRVGVCRCRARAGSGRIALS